jgi:hypothetical protein
MILKIFSLIFSVNLFGFDYEMIFKVMPQSVTIKYLIPYYKNGKLRYDKVDEIYRVRFLGSDIIEEARGKSLKELDTIKKYRYIRKDSEIKSYCNEILKDELPDMVKSLCFSKDEKIKEIMVEMLDNSVFRIIFNTISSKKEKKYFFDPDFNLDNVVDIVSDDRKREEISYTPLGIMKSRTVYKKDNYIEEVLFYENDVLKKKVSKEYRTDNTLRKETIYEYLANGEVSLKIISIYDTTSLKEEEMYYDSRGNLYKKFKFEYEKDVKGNWIKLIKYDTTLDKKLSSIILREIEY